MFNKNNWLETRQKLCCWWHHENTDGPILRAPMINSAFKEMPLYYRDLSEKYTSPECIEASIYNQLNKLYYTAEAYPNVSIDFGPGSYALYLGCEPGFNEETVWFEPCLGENYNPSDIKFDRANKWLNKHLSLFEKFRELTVLEDGDKAFFLNIPDLVEDLDIYAAMRSPQNALYDIYDKPEYVKKALAIINENYPHYYKMFYDLVKWKDESCSFTAFNLWAPGPVTKIQCDINAMLSPEHFREFVVPGLTKICREIDYTLYHLDGPETVVHLDALMEIEELDALQWMPGTVPPDGASELWYPIYEKVLNAGKGLQIHIWKGEFDGWVNAIDKIVTRFGSRGLYFLLPDLTPNQLDIILKKRDKDWK